MIKYAEIDGYQNRGDVGNFSHVYQFAERFATVRRIILVHAYEGRASVFKGYAYDKTKEFINDRLSAHEREVIEQHCGKFEQVGFDEFAKRTPLSSWYEEFKEREGVCAWCSGEDIAIASDIDCGLYMEGASLRVSGYDGLADVDINFCPNCGRRLREEKDADPIVAEEEEQPSYSVAFSDAQHDPNSEEARTRQIGKGHHPIARRAVLDALDGRTQGWLAKRSGLSSATISSVLNGHTFARSASVVKIAKALGVEPVDIIAKEPGEETGGMR